MNQTSFSKSELARQAPSNSLIWKKNDGKAQKNGSHSNIYWVKVLSPTSRNNPSTRTDHRNPPSGAAPTSTSATGRTTRRTVSAFSTTPTATSSRVAGAATNDTVRVPTGWQTPRTSCGDSTLETGRETLSREEGPCSTRREIGTTGCGWTACRTGRDG